MKTNWENFERDVLEGADRVTEAKEKPRSKAKQKQHEPRPDIVAPAFSDDALALQFADRRSALCRGLVALVIV
jgi:hypothetical protein